MLLLPGFIDPDKVPLLGTLFTFALFLILLPSWVTLRWQAFNPFLALGIRGVLSKQSLVAFAKGFYWAFILVLSVLFLLFLGSWVQWKGGFSITTLLNAACLGIGVGFAEELIFRGWLWKEVNLFLKPSFAFLVQAMIFSLVHIIAFINLDLSFLELTSLLLGLFLLGLLLAVRRMLDHGSLSGAIGLHGGLVGLWFFITSNLLDISQNTPIWVVGPGGISPNPIGSAIGISSLGLILLFNYRIAVAIAGRPSKGERKASSKGAIP